MFTLIYNNGQLNRPDTLPSFIQANVGKWPLIQIDCVTPYRGTEKDLVKAVCKHLSHIDSQIEVTYNMTQNCSTGEDKDGLYVSFLVVQIHESENR